MDGTDAMVPVPDIPPVTTPNDAIYDKKCDFVASVVQGEWAACYKTEMPRG
jgi:hypothetical protein